MKAVLLVVDLLFIGAPSKMQSFLVFQIFFLLLITMTSLPLSNSLLLSSFEISGGAMELESVVVVLSGGAIIVVAVPRSFRSDRQTFATDALKRGADCLLRSIVQTLQVQDELLVPLLPNKQKRQESLNKMEPVRRLKV